MEGMIQIRPMRAEDYDRVHDLWLTIEGFGIRSIDDSREDVLRFIERNPETSVVAVYDGEIVGSILCGNDGRGKAEHTGVNPVIVLKYHVMCTQQIFVTDQIQIRAFCVYSLQQRCLPGCVALGVVPFFFSLKCIF